MHLAFYTELEDFYPQEIKIRAIDQVAIPSVRKETQANANSLLSARRYWTNSAFVL